VTAAQHPEEALALSYAPADRRAGVQALFALDETLGQILRTTREPMVGQMRLTWWHEALAALDVRPPPAQPVLQALASDVVPRGVRGAAMAEMIDGWEILLEPDPLDRSMLDAYATQRGGKLFALAGQILGATTRDPLERAGAGWALADLAQHSRDGAAASVPRALAATALKDAMRIRWSGSTRMLGAMALRAQMDLAAPADVAAPTTSPARIARLAWHRLSGR